MPEAKRRIVRFMSPSGLLRSNKVEDMRVELLVMNEEEVRCRRQRAGRLTVSRTGQG